MDAAEFTSVAWDTDERSERPHAHVSPLVAVEPFVEAPERLKAHGSRAAKLLVLAADTVAIATAMAVAAWIRWIANDTPEALGPLWITALVSIPVWLAVFARYKLYTAAAISSLTAEFEPHRARRRRGRRVHRLGRRSSSTRRSRGRGSCSPSASRS